MVLEGLAKELLCHEGTVSYTVRVLDGFYKESRKQNTLCSRRLQDSLKLSKHRCDQTKDFAFYKNCYSSSEGALIGVQAAGRFGA